MHNWALTGRKLRSSIDDGSIVSYIQDDTNAERSSSRKNDDEEEEVEDADKSVTCFFF